MCWPFFWLFIGMEHWLYTSLSLSFSSMLSFEMWRWVHGRHTATQHVKYLWDVLDDHTDEPLQHMTKELWKSSCIHCGKLSDATSNKAFLWLMRMSVIVWCVLPLLLRQGGGLKIARVSRGFTLLRNRYAKRMVTDIEICDAIASRQVYINVCPRQNLCLASVSGMSAYYIMDWSVRDVVGKNHGIIRTLCVVGLRYIGSRTPICGYKNIISGKELAN